MNSISLGEDIVPSDFDSKIVHRRERCSRHGLTLVEMLVSVTLTLLIVLAVVQVFDMIGNTVTFGRATIEMSGQLRAAAHRLQDDLDNCTASMTPPIDPSKSLGYFEYVEGRGRDGVLFNPPDGTNPASYLTELVDADNDGEFDTQDNNGLALSQNMGDIDDRLGMTIKSTTRPFHGNNRIFDADWARVDTTAAYNINYNPDANDPVIESNVAEVAWWVTQFPRMPVAGQEVRLNVYRRVLLIRPDINEGDGMVPDPPRADLPGGFAGYKGVLTPSIVARFFQENDISVRVHSYNAAGQPVGLTANSLADLSTPMNRFGHLRINTNFLDPTPWQTQGDIYQHYGEMAAPNTTGWLYPVDTRLFAADCPGFDNDPDVTNPPAPATLRLTGAREGEDIVLRDAIGFDVKAFDPEAPVLAAMVQTGGQWAIGTPELAMLPSDPGYRAVLPNLDNSSIALANVQLSTGAFVDLNFTYDPNDTTPGNSQIASYFSNIGNGMDVGFDFFDTWTTFYERDGRNQDGDFMTDEGTDGINNFEFGTASPRRNVAMPQPGVSVTKFRGIDDFLEQEAPAPYLVNLRGLQVQLRVWDVETSQVRQTSVVGDFTPK